MMGERVIIVAWLLFKVCEDFYRWIFILGISKYLIS
jgi:hypothetical protein